MGDFLMGDRVLGVQRSALEILRALDDMLDHTQPGIAFEILVPGDGEATAQFRNISVVRKGRQGSKLRRYFWQQVVFPAYVKRRKAIGVDMTLAYPVCGRHIVTIYDCIHEAYPENFRDHKLFHILYIARAWLVTHSRKKHIVTTSHVSRGEIEKYYPGAKGRISINYCGWEHMERIEADDSVFEKFPMAEKGGYYFALGSQYKHKNAQWIIRTAVRNPDKMFLITGADDLSDHVQTIGCDKPDNVVFTGYLTDGEIKALMGSCRALLQPSYYEGFGIPPLEALCLGRDAVVSDASCLPEIYGNSVRYLDPDSDGCDMDELMSQPVGSAKPVLEEYTWKNAAVRLINIIGRFA